MFRGTHYQRTQPDSHYDVIFVGSGLGCLSAASLLAQVGKKVLVLEQHYVLGGFTQTFSREGKYRWDVGVHYICEAHIEGTLSRRAFDLVSNSKLKWHETDRIYDRVIVGEKQVDYVAGRKNLIESLKSAFPNETKGIDEYFGLLYRVAMATPGYFASKAFDDNSPVQLLVKSSKQSFEKFSQLTLQEVLDRVTQDRDLQAVLAAQCGDYGLPPDQGSFAMHALVTIGYLKGAAFPVGGADAFADTIGTVISEKGGTLLVKAKVAQILVKDSTAYGVRMEDGKEITADQVVSGAGVFNTFGPLLEPAVAKAHRLDEKLAELDRSCAHMCLHLGFKGTNESLNLPDRNYWIYASNDLNRDFERFKSDLNAEFPLVFVNFPSAKDPIWHETYPDTCTAAMIAFAPYEAFSSWKDQKWKKRGPQYDALKAKMEKRLLAIFKKHFPDLAAHVSYAELSTPLSTRTFVNHAHGEIYGAAFDTQRFTKNWLRPTTPIRNLYLTGVDILTDGITGALFSGYLTALKMEPAAVMKLMARNAFWKLKPMARYVTKRGTRALNLLRGKLPSA